MYLRILPHRGWLTFLCLALTVNVSPSHAEDGSFEYAIKAAYLIKFAPFVVWPKSAGTEAQAFTICIVGDDPFGSLLENVIRGEQLDSRPIVIRRLTQPSQSSECQILYTGVMRWTAELRTAVQGRPVLTVAEDGSANEAIIQFLLVDGRVRFKIDALAAANSNLVLSTKLLALATSVRKQQK
jgi:hypothetical protein